MQMFTLPCHQSVASLTLKVSSLSSIRTVIVAQLNATDLDFNGQSPLHYEIADGNTEGKFSINAQTGLITVNDSTDMATSYKLKVRGSRCRCVPSCRLLEST